MTAWLSPLGVWFIDFAALATVLLAAASLLRLLLREPASRVLLTWGTWLGIAAAVGLTALPWWPRCQLTRVTRELTAKPKSALVASGDASASGPQIFFDLPSEQFAHQSFVSPLVPVASPMTDLWTWSEQAVLIWLATALVACGWMGLGLWQARRLLHKSQPAPRWIWDELTQIAVPRRPAADVLTSDRIASALALRARRPAILLPQECAVESNAKAVRAALAHEWAHIRHGDLWLLALERLLVPLLAVHPLFWWLRRSTRLDQELLADADAAGDKPVEYAEALIAWAKSAASPPAGLAALAMWERPSNLSRRVNMILNRNRPLTTWFGRLCGSAAVCFLLALVGGLSLTTLGPLAADDEPMVLTASTTTASDEPAADPQAKAPTVTVESADTSSAPGAAKLAASAASPSEQDVVTLKVTLLARDLSEVRNSKIVESIGPTVELIEGPPARNRINVVARVQTAELDEETGKTLTEQLQRVKGVKLLSRATIVAIAGQQATVEVREKGPRVEVEEIIDGKLHQRDQSTDIHYRVSVTPRIVGAEPQRLELTIDASQTRPNVVSPRTELKAAVGVEKTLLVVSSEPYVILISPTKLERQVVAVSSEPRAATRSQPLPHVAARQLPASAARSGQPATAAEPATAAPAVRAVRPVQATSRAATTQTAPDSTPTAQAELADQLRKLLDEMKIEGITVAVDPKSKSLVVSVPVETKYQTLSRLLGELVRLEGTPNIHLSARYGAGATQQASEPIQSGRQANEVDSRRASNSASEADRSTQLKLLELDLADGRLGLEVAEAELAAHREVRNKNQGAISQQELRKYQFQVERAKIQLQRIQIQLDAARQQEEPQKPR